MTLNFCRQNEKAHEYEIYTQEALPGTSRGTFKRIKRQILDLRQVSLFLIIMRPRPHSKHLEFVEFIFTLAI